VWDFGISGEFVLPINPSSQGIIIERKTGSRLTCMDNVYNKFSIFYVMSIIFTFTSNFMSSFGLLVKLLSSLLVIWLNSVGKLRQDLLTVDDVEIFNIKFNLPVDLSIQRHTRGGIRGDYRGLNRRQRFTLAVSKRPHGLCEHLHLFKVD